MNPNGPTTPANGRPSIRPMPQPPRRDEGTADMKATIRRMSSQGRSTRAPMPQQAPVGIASAACATLAKKQTAEQPPWAQGFCAAGAPERRARPGDGQRGQPRSPGPHTINMSVRPGSWISVTSW